MSKTRKRNSGGKGWKRYFKEKIGIATEEEKAKTQRERAEKEAKKQRRREEEEKQRMEDIHALASLGLPEGRRSREQPTRVPTKKPSSKPKMKTTRLKRPNTEYNSVPIYMSETEQNITRSRRKIQGDPNRFYLNGFLDKEKEEDDRRLSMIDERMSRVKRLQSKINEQDDEIKKEEQDLLKETLKEDKRREETAKKALEDIENSRRLSKLPSQITRSTNRYSRRLAEQDDETKEGDEDIIPRRSPISPRSPISEFLKPFSKSKSKSRSKSSSMSSASPKRNSIYDAYSVLEDKGEFPLNPARKEYSPQELDEYPSYIPEMTMLEKYGSKARRGLIGTTREEAKLIRKQQKIMTPFSKANEIYKSSRNIGKSLYSLKGKTDYSEAPKTYVSLIASHNNRLKCIVDKLFENSNRKDEFKDFYKYKYQNCCILRIDMRCLLNEKNKFRCVATMIYSGELNQKDEDKTKKYWKSSDDTKEAQKVKKGWFSNKTIDKYTAFPQFESIIDLNKLNDTRLNIFNLRNNNNYIFFLTRHGEGVHNTMKTAEKIKNQSVVLNAPLTPNGIEQAKKAGKKLNDYLKGARIQPIDFTFASDLQRAQYTVANMFVQLERRFINPTYSDIYILPCSHEIVGKEGNCDNAGDITWAENTPTKLDIDNIFNKKLNWEYYDMNFSRINKKNKTKQCRNTNMFTEMINIIDDATIMGLSPNRFNGGKTRRKVNKRY